MDADAAAARIALSNNYAGNSWRQAMLKSWEKVTKPQAVERASSRPPTPSPRPRTRRPSRPRRSRT
jgi:ABC-type sugar transport system substrate-binding protein